MTKAQWDAIELADTNIATAVEARELSLGVVQSYCEENNDPSNPHKWDTVIRAFAAIDPTAVIDPKPGIERFVASIDDAIAALDAFDQ